MTDAEPIQSEDDIVQNFLRKLAEGCDAALNLEDDAACLNVKPGTELVITTDALVSGVHFLPDTTAHDIGYKAGAVNVSDLVAKGATPIAFTLSLSLPETPSRSWIKEFSEGFGHWAKGKLIGGDLTRTPGPLALSITAIGEVPAGKMVRRTTAQVGDAVYVTGDVGASTAGLALLTEADSRVHSSLQAPDAQILIDRFLNPTPPIELTDVIRAYASAAMDISDGLVRDAQRMCAGSNVSMVIDAHAVPTTNEVKKMCAAGGITLDRLLTGGDDYQVLMTLPMDQTSAFEHAARAIKDMQVTRIGTVSEGCGELVVHDRDGNPMVFETTGHDHF